MMSHTDDSYSMSFQSVQKLIFEAFDKIVREFFKVESNIFGSKMSHKR